MRAPWFRLRHKPLTEPGLDAEFAAMLTTESAALDAAERLGVTPLADDPPLYRECLADAGGGAS